MISPFGHQYSVFLPLRTALGGERSQRPRPRLRASQQMYWGELFFMLQRFLVSFRASFLIVLLSLLIAPAIALAQQPASVTPSAEPASAEPASGGHGDPYASLLLLLEDETLRERLLEDLRGLRDGAPTVGEAVPVATPEIEQPVSLSRQVARLTRDAAKSAVDWIHELAAGLEDLQLGEAADEERLRTLGLAVLGLGATILATVISFLVLLRGVRRAYAGLAERAATHPSLARRAAAMTTVGLVDVFAVIIAWLIGYLFALFVIGEPGEVDTHHALFLNGFVIVELAKMLLRFTLSPGFQALRPLPMGDEDAAYWYAWLSRIVGVLGYGLLLVVPMVRFDISVAIGQALAILVGAIALLMAVVLVLQNRNPIQQWLERRSQHSKAPFIRSLLLVLAHSWHLVTIAYLGMLFIVSVVRPEDALPLILAATLKSLIAVSLGMLVSMALSRAMAVGVRLPEETQRNLPMLQQRLNAYVPNVLRVVQLGVFVAVLLYLFDAWGFFDLVGWLTEGGGSDLLSLALTLALLGAGSLLLWLAVSSWIEHRLHPNVNVPHHEPSARELTLLAIFRNAFTIALTVITVMIALSEIGIDIGPLLAGAGVLGLAIGFGAQNLVQDVITGVFIQLENALNVGDVVTVAGLTGTVEKLTIRSVGVRDLHGTYHLISFSQVGHVSNFMRGFSFHVGEYRIAYREDVDDAIERLKEAFQELRSDPEIASSVVDDLEISGVIALGDSGVDVRVRIKTLPGMQWGVGRAYNKLVKKHFQAADIQIPFKHLTLYFGENKEGAAPPVRTLQLDPQAQYPDAQRT